MVKKTNRTIGCGLAFVIIGFAAAQMASFEEFTAAIEEYQLTGYRMSIALALTLIALEICSVPFLLGLSVQRKAMRIASAACVVLVPALWAILTILVLVSGVDAMNAGYLGGFAKTSVTGAVLVFDLVWLAVAGFAFRALGGVATVRHFLR